MRGQQRNNPASELQKFLQPEHERYPGRYPERDPKLDSLEDPETRSPRQGHSGPQDHHLGPDRLAPGPDRPRPGLDLHGPGPGPGPDPAEDPDLQVLASASAEYGLKTPRVRLEVNRGRTVLCQVLVAAVAMTFALAGLAGQFTAERTDALASYQRRRAQDLLQETVQGLASFSFESVAALDGYIVHEAGSPQNSDYRVEIAVAPSNQDTLRITAVLRDTRTRRQITELVTFRGRI